MDRQERRAAKARARGTKLDRVTAIHEAGHAIARVMTVSDFGIDEDMAVSYIEIGSRSAYGKSIDGRAELVSRATTYGPTLSSDLQNVFNTVTANISSDQLGRNHIDEAIRVAEANGVDISNWLRARMLIAVFGAAAEARQTEKNIYDVWNGYEAEGDVRGAVSDGLHAGLSASEIEDFIDEAINRAKYLIARIEIWGAVTSVADAMPSRGRMPGERVLGLAKRWLPLD